MTSSPIKTTEQLAAESESRPENAVAVIKPTEQSAPSSDTENHSEVATNPQQPDSPQKEPKATPKFNETQLAGLVATQSKLSFKNTARLVSLNAEINKAKLSLDATEVELLEQLNLLSSKTAEQLKKNHGFQEQLKVSTRELMQELVTVLESGKSQDALSTWDKIQGNISNTSGKIRGELQRLANEHKDTLNKLRDWKVFASTEKKKQLIVQMKELDLKTMHASDISKGIASMHKEWKLLGRSSSNDELWNEFKTLSDLAYEPCKEYFKQRKQLMAENLTERRKLCDELEKDIARFAETDIAPSEISKLLNNSESLWKKYAPVEQVKIKTLQKRYYGLINQLRKIRKDKSRINAQAKLECIAAANALVELEDNKRAMAEAKTLQKQWKEIGTTSFKEDRKYWEDFRAACDKIFEKRKQEANQHQEELKAIEQGLLGIISSIEKLLLLEEDEFRDSRSNYQTLQQKFSNEFDSRIKQQRKPLTDKFNAVKRSVDMRFKNLPDKKLILLREKISAKTEFLENIEKSFFSLKNDEEVKELAGNLDRHAWKAISSIGRKELDDRLEDRFSALGVLKSLKDLKKLSTTATEQFRALCIECEIRSNTESPAQDQAQRMSIQLNQLKSGFGKSKPDRKENAKFAASAELESSCIGPLLEEDRQPYSIRLGAVVDKLK